MDSPPDPSSTRDAEVTLTELFHRVNSVIPDDQQLLTVEPEMLVADALDLLEQLRAPSALLESTHSFEPTYAESWQMCPRGTAAMTFNEPLAINA